MRRYVLAAGLALAPVAGHAQGVQQLLQGLTSGNQNQDRALQEAYERGYAKGRQDEAALQRRPQQGGYQQPNGYQQQPYDPYRR